MYIKNWDVPLNPNNVFIPYILVCIEGILRKIISIDKTMTKEHSVYPQNILDRLTKDGDSPLVGVKPNLVYIYWYPLENDPSKFVWKAESHTNDQLEFI